MFDPTWNINFNTHGDLNANWKQNNIMQVASKTSAW